MIVGSAEVRLTTDATGLPAGIRKDLAEAAPAFDVAGRESAAEFSSAFDRGVNLDPIKDDAGIVAEAAIVGKVSGEAFGDEFRRGTGGRDGKGLLGSAFGAAATPITAFGGLLGGISSKVLGIGVGIATWGPPIIAAGSAVVALLPALAVGVPAILGIAGAAAVVALSGKQLLSAVKPLADGVEHLKSAVGGALTHGFAADIKDLAEDILPILKVGLVDVAQGLNQAIRPLLQFADSKTGLGLVRDLFREMTVALQPLFDLITPIFKILLELGVAAAPGLLILTDAISGVVTRFAAFVDEGTKSGTLMTGIAGAVSGLLGVFSGLGAVLSPLIGLFAHFGPAVLAGLGTVLQVVGSALDVLVGTVESVVGAVAAGDSVLQPLIVGAQKFAAAVLPALGPTFDALKAFVAQVVPVVVGVLGPALGDLGTLLGTEVLPAFQVVLPIVGTAVAALVTGIGTVLSTVSGGIGVLQPIVDGIKGFAEAIGPQLQPTFEAVAKFAGDLLPTLADIGTQIIDVVGPALTEIGQIIGEQLLPAFQAVLPVIEPVAKFLLEVIGGAVVGALKGAINVIEGVLKIISGIFNVFAGVFTGDWGKAWEGIKQIFGGAFQAILGAVEVFLNVGILKGFKVALGLLGDLWKVGLDLLPKLFTLAVDGLKAIATTELKVFVEIFVKLPGRLLSALGDLGRLLIGKGGDVVDGLLDGVKAIVPKLLSFVKGIPGDIGGLFSGAGKLLLSAGRAIIQGLLDGAGELLPHIAEFMASKLPGVLQGPFKKALGIESPSKVFTEHGRDIVRGLIKGVDDESANAETALDKLAAKVEARYKASNDRLKVLQDQRTQYAANLANSAVAGANAFTGDTVTTKSILDALRHQIVNVDAFTANLAKLKNEGLSKDLYAQLTSLGVDQAGAAVKALAAAAPGTISVELDGLAAVLRDRSDSLGKTAAGTLFNSGVAAAQGLVDGLKSQRADVLAEAEELAKQMQDAGAKAAQGLAKGLKSHRQDILDAVDKMAEDLIKHIKSELKIKSPSEVFADIGEQIPAGLALGIDANMRAVSDASGRMAKASLIKPDLAQLDRLAQAQSMATLQTLQAGQLATGVTRINNYTIDASQLTPAELAALLADNDQLDAALHAGGL